MEIRRVDDIDLFRTHTFNYLTIYKEQCFTEDEKKTNNQRDSINAKNSNLNIKCIQKYLEKIFWNGSTDKEIMERLGLGNYHMLEINRIVPEEIGHVKKKGRLLNLTETHNQIICNKNHVIAYAHDPCTDVTVTKCLFDKLFRYNVSIMSTIFRVTVVPLVACCSIYGIKRYADERIISHSGLYFENQGPIKIMTTKWSLVAFYDISSFRQRKKTTNSLGAHFQEHKIFQTNCETNYALSKLLVHTTEEKKRSFSNFEKGIPYKAIAKAAQILFGLCDRFCIQRTNTDVNKLTDNNNTEVNFLEKQVRVIKLGRDEGPDVLINVNNDLK
ncbi:Envelope fusion protein [Aphis craccivora]|uniref:Envelope fusion protein n=1 Tax=Aphis craccivora TaxID=307492 RepID=A0A6G0XYW5_APHCR|nr:Envelope fusion protein [Aphis craccivora]